MVNNEEIISKFSTLYDNWLETVGNKDDNTYAKISHEIKNPLTLIKSTLQLIETQSPDVKGNKHWDSLYEEIDYICLLLNNFSCDKKTKKLEDSYVNIDNLIDNITNSFDSVAFNNNIEFFVSKPKCLPTILGNTTKLKEVFINLVKNAFEATDNGGTISIVVKHIEDFIIITITDTGKGIGSDKISTIFKPYVTYKKNGTGLGLNIVKSIVTQHGGHIDVASKVGVGTSFVVSLPTTSND